MTTTEMFMKNSLKVFKGGDKNVFESPAKLEFKGIVISFDEKYPISMIRLVWEK